ncbi:MAG: hypothetical protein HWQ41_04295 [Nostoc sp. NOS(2021)]|nr:hypothetical protein [Nostoc sp. NOS(2021)]MBN3894505.1 hypothetical protein [Nostoc sp. NOS(2021)]
MINSIVLEKKGFNHKNGTVELAELEEYVSTYGLVANLNVVSAAASPATT